MTFSVLTRTVYCILDVKRELKDVFSQCRRWEYPCISWEDLGMRLINEINGILSMFLRTLHCTEGLGVGGYEIVGTSQTAIPPPIPWFTCVFKCTALSASLYMWLHSSHHLMTLWPPMWPQKKTTHMENEEIYVLLRKIYAIFGEYGFFFRVLNISWSTGEWIYGQLPMVD